jgi:hypothetical protein
MERKVSSKQQRSMKNMDQPKLSTIWGDFWVQDKQLPSKTEFQAIANAKLVEIGECNIPRNQRFERINFDWSKRLNQAAKLFAQAWIYALEVHGKENLVLKAIGMTKAQVAHAIRASQTCMTFKNNARNQKDASRYFMTIVDMMNFANAVQAKGCNSDELQHDESPFRRAWIQFRRTKIPCRYQQLRS